MTQLTFLRDLLPLLRKVVVINAERTFPIAPDGELGAVYPYPLIPYADDVEIEYYGIIIIHVPRLKTFDDYMVTFIHELIHIYLYFHGIDNHDEKDIDKQAVDIVRREYDEILRWIKENGLYYDI